MTAKKFVPIAKQRAFHIAAKINTVIHKDAVRKHQERRRCSSSNIKGR